MPDIPEITDTDIMNAATFLTGYLTDHAADPGHSQLLWSITVLKIAAANWIMTADELQALLAPDQPACAASIPSIPSIPPDTQSHFPEAQ